MPNTLVLCDGGPTNQGARTMLPRLSDDCFAEVGEVTETMLRGAADDDLNQVVLVGTADRLTGLAVGLPPTRSSPAAPLAEITTSMGGTDELADLVAAADSAIDACGLWESAGLLGPAGRELCRRVADVLEHATGNRIAAQVVLVDAAGQKMIAMYGRLAR